MSKNLLEAAERIVDELTTQERLQLTKDLLKHARKTRWNRLFALIDERVQRYGAPSEEEILRLCREVRRGRHPAPRRP